MYSVKLSLKDLDLLGQRWTDGVSSVSLPCPALVCGGTRIKLRIDIDKPSNLAGECRRHLLK